MDAAAVVKSKFELYSNVWGFPQQLFVDNYVQAWRIARMGTYIFNSLIVSISTVAVVLVVASLAGYAFAKFRFRGGEVLFYTFVFTLIVPVQVTIIPLYAVVSGLGLSNTYVALILPYAAAGLPLSIFLLRAFFQSVPREIEEAARIDGCTEFAAFTRVVLPISGPGLATDHPPVPRCMERIPARTHLYPQSSAAHDPTRTPGFFLRVLGRVGVSVRALAMATVPVIIVTF